MNINSVLRAYHSVDRMVNDGKSYAYICRWFALTEMQLQELHFIWLRDHGVKIIDIDTEKLPFAKEKRARIVRAMNMATLRKSGLTFKQIGESYGITAARAREILQWAHRHPEIDYVNPNYGGKNAKPD